ncbi:MAG: hypothetical protein MJE68_33720 [Proteobacteria bacterium]|nr:hypothetical protein [Pseudomonadota bacterium]
MKRRGGKRIEEGRGRVSVKEMKGEEMRVKERKGEREGERWREGERERSALNHTCSYVTPTTLYL